jgi:hypothetical protein
MELESARSGSTDIGSWPEEVPVRVAEAAVGGVGTTSFVAVGERFPEGTCEGCIGGLAGTEQQQHMTTMTGAAADHYKIKCRNTVHSIILVVHSSNAKGSM